MLKRKIETYLVKWKESKDRKPLVIKGIRQMRKDIHCPEVRKREL